MARSQRLIIYTLFVVNSIFSPIALPAQQFPGIHFEEWLNHERTRSQPGFHARIPAPTQNSRTIRDVYGWYPYWVGDAYLGFRWACLSHLSFFCIELDAQGDIVDYNGWPNNWTGLIQATQMHDVGLTLTIVLFDSSAINNLVDSPTYRANAVANIVAQMLAGPATGINIDFEGSSLHKANLVLFMAELRTAMEEAAPGSHLSMATPSVDWTSCFDYDLLGSVCDLLIPMCYGYHWSGGPPGPIAPLTSGDIWGRYCITATIDDYLDPGYGTTPDRLAIGLPYYGRDWDVIGDPWEVPAEDGPNQSVARTYEYIRDYHESYAKYWDTHSQTPWYYYGTDRQVWFDNPESLALKYDLALERNLSGIAIWALGYDGGYPDLWDILEAYFTAPEVTPTPTQATATPSPTPKLSPTPPAELFYDLALNQPNYTSGDYFLLTREAYNPSEARAVDEWVVLEVAGAYWFYPAWLPDPQGFLTWIGTGINRIVILSFIWPEGDFGSEQGLRFWGALLNSGTFELVSNLTMVEFGFD